MNTIVDMLRANAAERPCETALVEVNPERHENRHITWRDYDLVETTDEQPFRREMTWAVFDEKANRFANLLLSRGVRKDDKVAILLYNCIEWLPIYFGILKTGAVVVPLNYRYTAEEIRYCLDLSDSDVLFFGPEFIGRVEDALPSLDKCRMLLYVGKDCPTFAEDYSELTANSASIDPMVPLSDEEDAAIYFSSGTTGFPKAILHNHQSILHAARMEAVHHKTQHDDVFLCIPPLYHTGAKIHLLGGLIVGSRSVLLRGVTPQTIFDTISKEHCTICWLLVPWAQDILLELDTGELKIEDFELDQWRLMHIGAQPVPKSLVAKWKQYFPKHDYDTNYGLSESMGPGCVHLGMENIAKVGAIGVAGYGCELKLIDAAGNTQEGNPAVGELCVKGPSLMTCYYKNPEATAETLVDGWLLTGDIAQRDEDGFYWLVDRKKDVIIMGGENIYPVQVEAFMAAYEPIKDVAVIGLPDERLGEISAAIVELKPDYVGKVTEEDIDRFCLELPRYKRPRKIIFDDVIRNSTGKIDKVALRKRYNAENLVERENHA